MSKLPSGACRTVQALIFVFFAIVSAASAAEAPTAQAEFDAGVSAFRAGDFESALSAFLEARRQGMDIPNLRFNLGLTYSRLGRYEQARTEFQGLRSVPGYAMLAEYNLGLIAARQNRREQAIRHLRMAERTAATPSQRRLVRRALYRLDAHPAMLDTTGYFLAGGGYDTNPTLVNESLLAAADASAFAEMYGSVDVPLRIGAPGSTGVRGGGYLRKYFSDTGFDLFGLQGGLGRYLNDAAWRTVLMAEADTFFLDGDHFQNTVGASVRRSRRFENASVRLGAQVSRIDSATAFDHLDGWRLLAEAEAAGPMGNARLRARYRFEGNDRRDLTDGVEFFSHSPLHNQASLALSHAFGTQSTLEWRADYRHSYFRDPNRFDDGGTPREERRVEQLAQAALRLRTRTQGSSGRILEYQYSNNRSSIQEFAYDRHLLLIGIEWLH